MAKTLKAREVIAILEAHGCMLERTKGSHRTYKRLDKRGNVWITQVSAHSLNEDVPKRSVATIAKQAGLDKKLFR